MVTGNMLIASGSLAAFLVSFLLCLHASNLLSGQARTWRLQQHAGLHVGARILQTGIPGLVGVSEKCLRLPRVRQFAKRACLALEQKGYIAETASVLSCLLAICLAALVLCMLTGRFILGLLVVFAIVLLVNSQSQRVIEARTESMRDALPDALSAMSSCFGAGFSLLQTFAHLEKEIQGPLGSLFGIAAKEMQAGVSPTQALAHIQKESNISELSFVAVALTVQHQTGGSMQSVLEATRESLKEELNLKRSLRVHTAQAKLSARVVIGVTIGLVAVMMLLSKDFLQPFFASSLGMVLLGLAIVMQVGGVLCIRRLLKIEVD